MTAKPNKAIENFLCFALYSASRTMTRLYGTYLDKVDLTYPQLLVLLVLWETPTMTVNAICESLLLDSGTVTPLLKRLESKGYLKRVRSKSDERSVEVTITSEGLKLRTKLKNLAPDMLCDLEMNVPEVVNLAKKIHDVREVIEKNMKSKLA